MKTLNAEAVKWLSDADGYWLAFKNPSAKRVYESLDLSKPYDIEIKRHREKRSLDANAYAWVLLDKLAAALQRKKEDLYIEYIKYVGVFKDFHLTEDEAKTFRSAWSMLGTGWPTEQVDYTPDGERLVIRAYYGSSTYNTKQMSRLIDAIVEDCKQMEIETLTPRELDAMKSRWGEVHGK